MAKAEIKLKKGELEILARDLGIKCSDKAPYYFISYNSEDETIVSKFAKCLEKYGIPMWYDKGIKIGTEWQTEIAERIDNCQAVIMFLSKNIFLKDDSYVHKEYELATEYSQKNVYVIMIDDIKKPDVPVRFRTWWTKITAIQCENAFEYSSPDECMQNFIENIIPQKKNNDLGKHFENKKQLLKYFDECVRMYDLNINLDHFVAWMMNIQNI